MRACARGESLGHTRACARGENLGHTRACARGESLGHTRACARGENLGTRLCRLRDYISKLVNNTCHNIRVHVG